MKGLIYQEVKIRIYTPNIGATKYIKQILTDQNKIIAENYNIQLSTVDRSDGKPARKH